MANMLENYGLEFIFEDDDSIRGFVGYVTKEGKAITGYYNTPYLFKSMGDAEFWVKTEKKRNGNLHVAGFDAHCGNNCVWDMLNSGIDITPKDSSKLSRIMIFDKSDGKGGFLPIELINADVLPSFLKGDKIAIQVVALPLDINYYADEEEYENSQPADENGKRWLIANGSMTALSFLYNHSPERYDQSKDYVSDRYVHFTATVKNLYHGTFELGGETHNTFIRCLADTEYGEIEFNHTLEQVPQELRENIKVGAVINGTCILCGDVAIDDYSDGIIRDFENNLRLIRYTLVKGDPERLRRVLCTDAVYETDTQGKRYVGSEKIIKRISYVQKNREDEYIANFATIVSVDDETLDYPVGTRCIVLSSEEEDNYESIVFIDLNEDGMISKIKISTDSRYHFKIDRPEYPDNKFEDFEIPDSVVAPIICRAKFNRIIPSDIDDERIIKDISDYSTLEQNAENMLDALRENPQNDVEKALANIFGYLFAKAIEKTVNESTARHEKNITLTASFIPSEAFVGEISSTLSKEKHVVLEEAMRLGTQFYKDFKLFVQLKDIAEEQFIETFKQAAVAVQRLGQMYSSHCFDND